MQKPERGVCCAGCPHRAAYVVVKEAVGRGRGKVYCGDAGCRVVGEVHPAATATPGGMARLLPRYAQAIPDGSEEKRAGVCVRFIPDEQLMADDAADRLGNLADEGACVLVCVLASSKAYAGDTAARAVAHRALELGAQDACVVDPFDSAGTGEVAGDLAERPGVHALVFASPCTRLMAAHPVEPAEIDRISCVGCQRCVQITGCPALTFQPPAAAIDPEACVGCDFCADWCRTQCVLSLRTRMTPAERRAARLDAAGIAGASA